MRRLKVFLVILLVSFLLSQNTNADFITYTDEVSYLSALSLLTGLDIISEGFEGSGWNSSRAPASLPSITVNDLTWSASDAISTINSGWTRSGTYGVFDTYGDPDALFSVSSGTDLIYGAGGWFNHTTATDINISYDGSTLASLSFAGTFGHIFLGVIDTDGASEVSFYTNSGHFGADDFTFAVGSSVPEPATFTLLLLGAVSILGCGVIRKQKK